MQGDSAKDIYDKYPLISTEIRERRVHPLRNYTGAGRWEFYENADRQHHTLVKETPTFVTLLDGGVETKYRKTTAKDDMGFWGGGLVEIAYKTTEIAKRYFNSTTTPLMWQLTMPAWQDILVIKSPTWPAGETYTTQHVTETRLIPATVMWVGCESSVVCSGGVFQPKTKMFFSQVRTDQTPTMMPVDSHGDFNYSSDTRSLSLRGHMSISNMGETTSTLIFANGRTFRVSLLYAHRVVVDEFLGGCSVELIQHAVTYRQVIVRRKSYRCKAQGTLATVITPIRRAPVSPHKEELARYVFNPVRMTRIHGDDALDIMADCY